MSLSREHSEDGKYNLPRSNESGISGNAPLVITQSSSENHPKPSPDHLLNSYQLHMSNASNVPLRFDQDNKGRSSGLGISDSSSLKMSSNLNTPPITALPTSASLNYQKIPLTQEADHCDSNKNINLSDNSITTLKSSTDEKPCNDTQNDAKVLITETKETSELNEKCDPPSVGSSVRTDISDKGDSRLTYKTAKNAGAIEDDIETTVKSTQESEASSKFTLQSHEATKSDSRQNSFSLNFGDSSLKNKDDLSVRKSLDSTTNSSISSETSKGKTHITNTFDTFKSNSKNLAALEEAINEKKATAMLPIQKLSSVPPKNTASLFSGSVGIFKTGSGNMSGGCKVVDNLLKQAEARAAKEASAAAATANAKNETLKEDASKGISLLTTVKGNVMEKGEKKSSEADDVKGNKNFPI